GAVVLARRSERRADAVRRSASGHAAHAAAVVASRRAADAVHAMAVVALVVALAPAAVAVKDPGVTEERVEVGIVEAAEEDKAPVVGVVGGRGPRASRRLSDDLDFVVPV